MTKIINKEVISHEAKVNSLTEERDKLRSRRARDARKIGKINRKLINLKK